MKTSSLHRVLAWIFILAFSVTGVPYVLYLLHAMTSNNEVARATNVLDREILALGLTPRAKVSNKSRAHQIADTLTEVRRVLREAIERSIAERHLQSVTAVLSQTRTVLMYAVDPTALPPSALDPETLAERMAEVRHSAQQVSRFGLTAQVIPVADRNAGEELCAAQLSPDTQALCTVEYSLEPNAPKFAYFRSDLADPEADQKLASTVLEYAQHSMSPEIITIDNQLYVLYPTAHINLSDENQDAERCIRMAATSAALQKCAQVEARRLQPMLNIRMTGVSAVDIKLTDRTFSDQVLLKVFGCAAGEGGIVYDNGRHIAFKVTSIKNDPHPTPPPALKEKLVKQVMARIAQRAQG